MYNCEALFYFFLSGNVTMSQKTPQKTHKKQKSHDLEI